MEPPTAAAGGPRSLIRPFLPVQDTHNIFTAPPGARPGMRAPVPECAADFRVPVKIFCFPPWTASLDGLSAPEGRWRQRARLHPPPRGPPAGDQASGPQGAGPVR